MCRCMIIIISKLHFFHLAGCADSNALVPVCAHTFKSVLVTWPPLWRKLHKLSQSPWITTSKRPWMVLRKPEAGSDKYRWRKLHKMREANEWCLEATAIQKLPVAGAAQSGAMTMHCNAMNRDDAKWVRNRVWRSIRWLKDEAACVISSHLWMKCAMCKATCDD